MKTKRIVWRAAKTAAVFLVSVLVLSLLVFVVSRLAPGDPLVSFYGERAEKLKPAERAAAEARLGLDQPILRQYALWLKGALRGEFGISYKYKMDVRRSSGQGFRLRCASAALASFLRFSLLSASAFFVRGMKTKGLTARCAKLEPSRAASRNSGCPSCSFSSSL